MLGLRDVVVLTPSPSSLQHRQQQQHASDHHPNIPLPSSAALGVGVGVGVGIFPFLAAATPCLDDCAADANFWRTVRRTQESNFPRKDAVVIEEVAASGANVDEKSGGASASSQRVCEDCGNRAKRDCSFRRCRTCCKSRGYDCSTHLKSTWVPAAVRRERQVTVAIGGTGGGGCSTGSSSGANKRPRIAVSSQNATSASHTSTSNNAAPTTPRSFNTGHYLQDSGFKESLPGSVNAPAVFRCIRVTSINDEEAEIGYQATVTISGHVFKGFLYDQGVDRATNRNSSSPIVEAFQSSAQR